LTAMEVVGPQWGAQHFARGAAHDTGFGVIDLDGEGGSVA